MLSNHLILCLPLLLPPSVFPSIRVFSNESVLHIRWPKYWSFSFNISPSNEHPGLISFRVDWVDLLAAQWFTPVAPEMGSEKCITIIHHYSVMKNSPTVPTKGFIEPSPPPSQFFPPNGFSIIFYSFYRFAFSRMLCVCVGIKLYISSSDRFIFFIFFPI